MGNRSSKKKAQRKAQSEAAASTSAPPSAPTAAPVPASMKLPSNTRPSLKNAARRDSVRFNKQAIEKRAQDTGNIRVGLTTEELLARRKAAVNKMESEGSGNNLKTISTIDDPSAWQPDAYETHHDINTPNGSVAKNTERLPATKKIVASASSGSDSDSDTDYSDDDLIEDWTQTPDEEFVDDKKTEEVQVNCIPETRFCTFFHQFTLNDQRLLLNVMESRSFTDGQDVVTQGDMGNEFFIITEGEVVVIKTDRKTGEEKELTHLYRGQNFGEISMIYGGKRVASVRAVGKCSCLVLSKAVFEQQHHLRMFLITKKVPLLAELSQEDRLTIVNKLQPRSFSEGDYVITQGDIVVDDAFYMITKGKCAVVDKEKTLTRLYEGHCFGEMALVLDKPRAASVVATTDLKCMCLTKQDFQGALAGSVALANILKKFAEEREQTRLQRKKSASKILNTRQKKLMRQKSISNVNDFVETKKCTSSGSFKKGTRQVNQYKFICELGSGAFSTVYKAENSRTNQTVAIKVMDKLSLGKKTVGSKTSLLDDVYREIRAQKMLRHEGIVQLLESIDDPDHQYLYLVIEYISGGEILVEEPLPAKQARCYFRDLLRGVEYMHYQGVVHRDIKPENILLTGSENGRTKIADFGTAVIVKKGEELTVPKGTPAFMAPELLSYETIKYTGRSADIWSLGATLYMLVVGEPPWMANNEMELARKVKNDELVFPESTDRAPFKLSPHLKQLIREMLTKDPSLRPKLATVMAHEWVTNEGSEPLQPLYVIASDSMTNFVDDEEEVDESNNLDDLGDGEMLISSDDDDSSDDEYEEVVEGMDGPVSPKGGNGRKKVNSSGGSSLRTTELDLEPLDASIPFPFEKCCASIANPRIQMVSALAENVGVRNNQEDRVVVQVGLSASEVEKGAGDDKSLSTVKVNVFAAYDGHGGDGTSTKLMMNLHEMIASQPDLDTDIDSALIRSWHIQDLVMLRDAAKRLVEKRNAKRRSLQRTSRKMPNEDNHLSGATAAMVVVVESPTKPTMESHQAGTATPTGVELVVAWAGDSRVVLSTQGGKATDLSQDHKASRSDETERIRSAGGSVDHKGRVGGDLAVSRAFGDIMHKGVRDGDEFLQTIMDTSESKASELQRGPLICTPDLIHHPVVSTDEFFIIASDGVWDVLTSQEAVNYVRRRLVENEGDVDAAAEALVQKALHSGTVDNVSVVITVMNVQPNV